MKELVVRVSLSRENMAGLIAKSIVLCLQLGSKEDEEIGSKVTKGANSLPASFTFPVRGPSSQAMGESLAIEDLIFMPP